jgi:dihydropyrimidine dehydrogenase (NAD+) subunit PreA
MQQNKINYKDLNIGIADVKFLNPIGVGSVGMPCIKPERLTPKMHSELLLKHVIEGAGFICLPVTCHVPDALLKDLERKTKVSSIKRKSFRPILFMRTDEKRLTMYNVGPNMGPSRDAAELFQKDTLPLIKILKEEKPKEIPIIGNLAGLGAFPESYISGAKALNEAGVDLIEINLSSPAAAGSLLENVDCYFDRNFPLTNMGLFLGDQPDLAEVITREVVKAVGIPVGVKISPETGFPRVVDLARKIKKAGAKFITCSNFGIAILEPDIYNQGRTKWASIDGNPFVVVGGDWLRTIVFKQLATIAKFVPGIDLIACGGITTPEQVVQAMMLGAKVVQKVTPVIYQGRKAIKRDINFLLKYLEQEGFNSLDEIVGLGLKYIKPSGELHSIYETKKVFAIVNEVECTGCGICADSICLSLSIENGKAKVDTGKCLGCGMCVEVCPRNAVSLKKDDVRY